MALKKAFDSLKEEVEYHLYNFSFSGKPLTVLFFNLFSLIWQMLKLPQHQLIRILPLGASYMQNGL